MTVDCVTARSGLISEDGAGAELSGQFLDGLGVIENSPPVLAAPLRERLRPPR